MNPAKISTRTVFHKDIAWQQETVKENKAGALIHDYTNKHLSLLFTRFH